MTTYLRGVEMPLPEGEQLLWQGSPNTRELAIHAFHARKIAIYFACLMLLTALLNLKAPSFASAMASSAALLALGGGIAVIFAITVAALSSRTTLYAITDKRVVMKVGIALPIVLNIPLSVVESVDIKKRSNGAGNLALKLAHRNRVAYAVLWPHARAWRVRYPEPLLRDLPDITEVGHILAGALAAAPAAATVNSGTGISSDSPYANPIALAAS